MGGEGEGEGDGKGKREARTEEASLPQSLPRSYSPRFYVALSAISEPGTGQQPSTDTIFSNTNQLLSLEALLTGLA